MKQECKVSPEKEAGISCGDALSGLTLQHHLQFLTEAFLIGRILATSSSGSTGREL